MNTFALEIWYDEGSACTFYTARCNFEDVEGQTETDKFFNCYAVEGHQFENEAYQLFRLITESIGNRYGATDDFFDRPENNAYALPPKPKQWIEEIKEMGKHFPLRLYCYRVSEQIVILFNGGIKDADTAQASEGLSMKFYEAQTFAKRIENELRSSIIEISNDGRYLLNFDGTTHLIL